MLGRPLRRTQRSAVLTKRDDDAPIVRLRNITTILLQTIVNQFDLRKARRLRTRQLRRGVVSIWGGAACPRHRRAFAFHDS
jgi:hypothetical protein